MNVPDQTDGPADTAAETSTSASSSTTRWVLIVLVVVAIVLFITWARRNPPFDDRVPDEDGIAVLVVHDIDDRGGL